MVLYSHSILITLFFWFIASTDANAHTKRPNPDKNHTPEGTWSLTISTTDEIFSGTLTIISSEEKWSAILTVEFDPQPITIDSISVIGNDLAFMFHYAEYGTIAASLTLDDDSMIGSFDVEEVGLVSMSGTRIKEEDLHPSEH
ncbi:MAG: hypothetical protein OXF08_00145 [Bacteroidetes bacterium]|nr:hypothetical protein [Bacteroidota bacterium]